jgi:hypothetical protein
MPHNPPPEAAKEQPVAWRVKDLADGWTICDELEFARKISCRMNGALIEPLYRQPPTPHRDFIGRLEKFRKPDDNFANGIVDVRSWNAGANAMLDAIIKELEGEKG